jgi:hypothetical protein
MKEVPDTRGTLLRSIICRVSLAARERERKQATLRVSSNFGYSYGSASQGELGDNSEAYPAVLGDCDTRL